MIIFAGWLAAMRHPDRLHNSLVVREDVEIRAGGEAEDQVLADPVHEPAVPDQRGGPGPDPAIHPVEAVIPASWHSSTVAR